MNTEFFKKFYDAEATINLGDKEPSPASINVDEAAEKLLTDFPFDGSIKTFAKMVFKAGAEWQSQQPEKSLNI